jgi:hypothetical protein
MEYPLGATEEFLRTTIISLLEVSNSYEILANGIKNDILRFLRFYSD